MNRIISIVITIACLSALTGCASIVSGTNQPISVHNGSVQGATCSLENNKGRWFVSHTPATVVVNRSYGDLKINCHKAGLGSTHKKVASHTKALAFGNIIFGGLIGASIDMADGAAYDYPYDIYVPMQKGGKQA